MVQTVGRPFTGRHRAAGRKGPPYGRSEGQRHRRRACVLAIVLTALAGWPDAVGAQQPAQKPPPAPPVEQPAPEAYTYNPEGRRDPFVSLLNRGADLKSAIGKRPDGLSGLPISEVSVKGIVRDRGNYVAIVQAPDNKTYTLRPGDRLFDGVVKTVTPEAVVFMQEVNDPLSLVKQREVRKPLRPMEDAR